MFFYAKIPNLKKGNNMGDKDIVSKDKDKQIVVNTILKRLKELTNGDELEYRNYIKKVNVLSTNRDLETEVKKGVKMLSVNIEKTPFYKIGKEEGIEEGIAKGITEGIFKSAMVMINKFKISIDETAKELNIKKEELLEYMKKKPKRE